MQRGQMQVFIMVGIITLAGIAGGAYFLGRINNPAPVSQSTPQQTVKSSPISPISESTDSREMANWKTYTNKKYKFMFKYPPEWVYEDSSDLGLGEDSVRRKSGYHILLGDPNVRTSAGGDKTIIAGSVSINIYNKENYALYTDNPDDYYKAIYKEPIRKVTYVNGLTIEEVHHEACPTSDDCISILFKNKGNVFTFDTWVWKERYKDLDTIYKILPTFKFIDDTDARIRVDIKQIQTALELYFSDYKYYPPTLQEFSPAYLTNMPNNPYDNSEYLYQSLNTDYQLTGKLGDGSEYTVFALR